MRKLFLAVAAAASLAARGAAPENAPDLPTLERMTARFARTELAVDLGALAPGDRTAVAKLVEASRVLDDLYLGQVWSGNHALLTKLKADSSPHGRARLHEFLMNAGPWSELDDKTAFVPGVPPKPPAGASFYPEDMTKDEF